MTDEELKKAAEEAKQTFRRLLVVDNIEAFLAGAEWMKKQMMEEAVEGEVRKSGNIGFFEITNEQQFYSSLNKFQNGDKVRVIIVKED